MAMGVRTVQTSRRVQLHLMTLPGHGAFEVKAVVKGVHEAIGRAQQGQGMLGCVCSAHQLQHGPSVAAHVVLESAAPRNTHEQLEALCRAHI